MVPDRFTCSCRIVVLLRSEKRTNQEPTQRVKLTAGHLWPGREHPPTALRGHGEDIRLWASGEYFTVGDKCKSVSVLLCFSTTKGIKGLIKAAALVISQKTRSESHALIPPADV